MLNMLENRSRGQLFGDPERMAPKVSRGAYYYCLVVWLVSLAAIPFFAVCQKGMAIYYCVMFMMMVAAAFASQFYLEKNPFDRQLMQGGTGKLIFTIMIICFVLAAASIAVLDVYGGNPEVTDGGYAIVSHNNVVKEIGETEYKALSVVDKMGFVCMLAGFTSLFLLHARKNRVCTESGSEQVE